jgi:N-acetylated-alpha-linked acidic dipeptidase
MWRIGGPLELWSDDRIEEDSHHPGEGFMRFVYLTLAAIGFSGAAAADNIVGFDDAGSVAQRALEAEFDTHISAAEMDEWLKRMSARPHHVGSAMGRENAEFMAELLASWGFETEIAEYRILLPTPRVREVELVAPTRYSAGLTEDSLPEDPSTSEIDELLPPYNAFSRDGEVEAELVFVNYGLPEDYEMLERYGISVEGKIAIAKYGRSWRGIKPKLAGEKGAIGTIIYSDPADDGYGAGDVYPKGPFKNESGVQRGSVMDMPTYPGDVLTPGRGATRDAERLDREDAPTITKIPVLPISYRDALPLLAAMDGAVVPDEWRGGLPITYHLGPGPARVRLKAEFDWNLVPAYNVIARMEGSEYPDEWVIRGNHHDGWNHGAADPLSGMIATLAEAKAVAELAKAGDPPKRTVIYAAWDAEEPGLIGSTEWAEQNADDLKRHAVAYLNTDGTSRGFLNIGGSHTLERYLNQVIEELNDPLQDVSLKERRRAALLVNGDDKAKAEAKSRDDLRIDPLGSGSDYTPFLQHLGIASANLGFGGEASDGSYHTMYDTYEHYTRFRDPDLVYTSQLPRVTGRATLRLANASRLPFDFTGFADNVALYVSELEELANTMRERTVAENRLIEEGAYAAALDPRESLGPPLPKAPVPHFNFAPLRNALDRLTSAADAFDTAAAQSDTMSETINELLYTSERLLTRDEGLVGRNWYKHHIYAPGFYTGYGVKTIPGVREAIEQRDYEKVSEQIDIAADVLNRMADRIETLEGMIAEEG